MGPFMPAVTYSLVFLEGRAIGRIVPSIKPMQFSNGAPFVATASANSRLLSQSGLRAFTLFLKLSKIWFKMWLNIKLMSDFFQILSQCLKVCSDNSSFSRICTMLQCQKH